MSNAKRPTAQRRHTRATDQARDAELDQGLSITVDGRTHTVRMGDLTALDAQALRRECGYSFMGLMRAFEADPDVDLVAAVVWLARRLEGERLLAYTEVASEIGYDVDIDLVPAEPEADEEKA